MNVTTFNKFGQAQGFKGFDCSSGSVSSGSRLINFSPMPLASRIRLLSCLSRVLRCENINGTNGRLSGKRATFVGVTVKLGRRGRRKITLVSHVLQWYMAWIQALALMTGQVANSSIGCFSLFHKPNNKIFEFINPIQIAFKITIFLFLTGKISF